MWIRTLALASLLAWFLPGPATSIEIPPENSCPPFPIRGESGAAPLEEDVIPSLLSPGTQIDLEGVSILRNYLPRQVWERRTTFFFEGMQLELGPCYRRYPAAPFFEQATQANADKARLDADGNLLDYAGIGLPFPTDSIDPEDPEAGWKWAWNYRYRYQGAGFRGEFRIIHIRRRGRTSERFEGNIFLLPMHGYPDSGDQKGKSFVSGGDFRKPSMAKGLKWRQFRPLDADVAYTSPDEVFLWIPQTRRVRRSPPIGIEGLFMPSYTRGGKADTGQGVIPSGSMQDLQIINTPDVAIATTEHWRRGFVGLVIRPNAYRFTYLRTQDVIAPSNSKANGFPGNPNRSYGPSGLSLASDRWDIRRAVVIKGEAKDPQNQSVAAVTLWIDALTLQPLYYVSYRTNRLIREVGIFAGRYTGDDPFSHEWEGDSADYGVIQPVAQSFWVTGDNGWLRESFDLRSDPPTKQERKSFTSTHRLLRTK